MIVRLAIAAFVTAGLIGMPVAALAKKHRPVRHHIPIIQSNTGSLVGTPTTSSGIYGTSGSSVGTVTAPSIGSYNWPSVGVTNAVPTWSNTNPQIHR